jgi:hypothetical protein
MDPEERDPACTAICVAGMHRCGTSFMAGALQCLGISLGDPDRLMPPGPDNPVGYFEIESVMEFDETLLGHLGGAWDQPPVLEPGWAQQPGLEPFRARASEIINEVFGAPASRRSLIAFKDPRISLLLPFWRTVIPIATTIVLVRDPREVAASLAARKYPVDGPQAASLWLRYLFAAAANDPDHLLVRYADLFDDLSGTLAAVARHLELPPPDARAEAAARSQLEPSLRHHVAIESTWDDNPLMSLARAVWNDGAVNLQLVPQPVADALARGWLRPPLDGELLARARAEVVTLKESVRRLNQQLKSSTR